MAEEGVEGTNPFSFKGFVNHRDVKIDQNQNGLEDDIFGLNLSRQDNLQAEVLADNLMVKSSKKKDKVKENPFSFKKFLSTPNKHSENTLARDVPLCTKELFPKEEPNGSKKKERTMNAVSADDLDNNSDDFSHNFNIDSIPSIHDPLDIPCAKSATKKNVRTIEIISDDVLEDQCASQIHHGLPDFLSDGAALTAGVKESKLSQERGGSLSQNEDLMKQIRIIQEENERLRKELSREKQKCSEKNQKLSQLKIDLERQKKKETEETAIMEMAVQKVEQTLVATTSRAVQAEALVGKLKQESKDLQNQVSSLNAEVQMLKSGDTGLADLRERTKYSSEQLRDAAISAERNLKELMSGVDKLKLVSVVLASLEKVSDFKDSGSKSTENSHTQPS